MNDDLLTKINADDYYAVIFASVRSEDSEGYQAMMEEIVALAQEQPGFLGLDSARQDIGITVSYWQDVQSIKNWREHSKHKLAQQLGREKWYKAFSVRICKNRTSL